VGDDFGGDEETILSSTYDRPVMVHRYPSASSVLHAAGRSAAELALGFDISRPKATAKSSAAANALPTTICS